MKRKTLVHVADAVEDLMIETGRGATKSAQNVSTARAERKENLP